ncbi:MAG: hypothetical protein B7Z55_05025 [Planctomycetales bacterium 12-60-4]|nr:MAG: hypothetical protein B7Z55_05025 [Planctomycetales bacterium 12-60-4]
MQDDHDLLADLPPPREDEPSSLRQDIADELGDHLACAFHRELVKSGDAETAHQRVLNRFGDPQRVALQLWLQAMWSRIMLKRIGLGVQVALLLAVMVASGLLMQAISQMPTAAQLTELRMQSESNRQMLATVLARLPQPAPDASEEAGMMAMSSEGGSAGAMATMGSGEMSAMGGGMMSAAVGAESQQTSPLTIRFVTGTEEGPPLQRGSVTVLDESQANVGMSYSDGARSGGMGFAGPATNLDLQHSGSRTVVCPDIKPGRYQIRVQLPEGLAGEMRVVVRPNERKTVTIVAPEPDCQRLVTIVPPTVPEDLRDKVRLLSLSLAQPFTAESPGTMFWKFSPWRTWTINFDGQSGLVSQIGLQIVTHQESGAMGQPNWTVFQPDDPAADRFVTLLDGKYQLKWGIEAVLRDADGKVIGRPDLKFLDHRPLRERLETTATVSANNTDWKFELPEEVWQAIREACEAANATKGSTDNLDSPAQTGTSVNR